MISKTNWKQKNKDLLDELNCIKKEANRINFRIKESARIRKYKEKKI